MTVNTLTLYMPGSNVGIQVSEGGQYHQILVAMGANSIPSAPGQTVRADPFPQYVDDDELAAALAGVGDGASDAAVAALVANSGSATAAALKMAFGLVYVVPAPTGVAGTDQAAVQSAIDEATADAGGIVQLQPGSYAMNAELILADRVLLRGMGSGTTTLHWSTDIGAGQYALRQPVDAGIQLNAPAVESLRILGPANSIAVGTAHADMDGWKVGQNVNGRNVLVRGFRAGAVFIGDHNKMDACEFSGSYYNVLFPEDRLTGGNQAFIHCSFTGATFAGIAVEGNVSIDSSIFIGGHTGYSPYCFYKFGTGATSALLSNCLLHQLSFESVGNAAILDESTTAGATLYRTTISAPGHSWDATYRISGRARDYGVDVYSITDTYLQGTFVSGDVATFNVRGGFSGMSIESSDIPTFICPTPGPGPLLQTSQATARYFKTSAAVAVRDLLEGSGETVSPYGTLNREYAGVALAGAASGGWVPAAYKGRVEVGNGATAIGAGGTPVRPSSGALTKVAPALGGGSNGYTFSSSAVFPDRHPIIGRTDRDIAANGTGFIWLNDPGPDRTYVAPGAVGVLPTASSTYRGQMLRVEGGSGVADVLYVCMKDSANAYAWKAVTLA